MQQQPPNPSPLSLAFISTLISHSPHHTIPHEFILKSLQLPNFTHLSSLGYLPAVPLKLVSLPTLIEKHELTNFLQSQGIDKIQKVSSSLFAEFTQRILPQVSRRDFYLGTDRSMRQEHSPGSYLIVYEEDTPTPSSLRWQKHTQKQGETHSSSWVQVCPGDDIVTIGQGHLQTPDKQWQGIKLYTREGHPSIQLGKWKGNLPKITVMIKTPHGEYEGIQVYLREFAGKKVIRAELRYVRQGKLCRYRENGGFVGREEIESSSLRTP